MIDRLRAAGAPADPLEDSRMPLGEHIEELRLCLWRALAGFAAAVVLGFFVGAPVLDFIARPVRQALSRFHERRLHEQARCLAEGDEDLCRANEPRPLELLVPARRLAALAGARELPPEEAWEVLPVRVRPVDWALALGQDGRRPGLISTHIAEPFTVYVKVSVCCGAVLASPWVFYQFWLFLAAGLYPSERRLVRVYLPLSVGLFLAGVALCEFVVLPAGVEYLLGFNEWLGVEPELRLGEWLDFALLMPLVFGCCFQTPLAMVFLSRAGLCDAGTYRRHRRLAVFLLAALAAVVSVTPDWYNMLALALPLWALYEVGILLSARAGAAAPEQP